MDLLFQSPCLRSCFTAQVEIMIMVSQIISDTVNVQFSFGKMIILGSSKEAH